MARILVVDDNEMNLKLVRVVLEPAGHEVRTAVDGASARSELARARPDLILMDVQLAGESGLELTRQLKADEATRGIPVVALTALAMRGDAERALEVGCDGYITKPIDTRSFPRLLAGWLPEAGTNR